MDPCFRYAKCTIDSELPFVQEVENQLCSNLHIIGSLLLGHTVERNVTLVEFGSYLELIWGHMSL